MSDYSFTADELTRSEIRRLRAGDTILLSGIIYTARDAAHDRMIGELKQGKKLPFDIREQIIYYAGPCPAKPGEIIGSCGPTTAGRMDAYTPQLLDMGLKAMIGKGARNNAVTEAICRNGSIYLGAIGGAGALIAGCIKKSEIIAYEDLGTEAVRRLEVEAFPCTVLTDTYGTSIYEEGIKKYKRI